MDYFWGSLAAILGLVIGSFLNVVIYRFPKGKNIAYPSSYCPACNNKLKWYHNIPIFSYLFLKGKCAFCKEKISPRYLIVELITMVAFLLIFIQFRLSYDLIFYFIFVVFGVLIAFIDLDEKIIPDLFLIVLSFNAIGFLVYKLLTVENYSWLSHIYGLLAGFLPFLLIRFISGKIYKREALGFGDVKYMAVIGFFVGWQKVLLLILIGSFLASVIQITLISLKKKERDEEFAFGPYLIFGSYLAIVYGQYIIDFYVGLFSR